MRGPDLPLPTIPDDIGETELRWMAELFTDLAGAPVRGGVASFGKPSAYALVWEWGNARQTQKGPKTTLGINPDGEQVWLTLQAPMGYIRINQPVMVAILADELQAVDWAEFNSAGSARAELKRVSKRVADRIADVIRQSVPVGEGDGAGALMQSIRAMNPDDPALEVTDTETEMVGRFGHFEHVAVLEQEVAKRREQRLDKILGE